MAKWVDTDQGFVNLDFVVSIDSTEEKRSGVIYTRYILKGVQGTLGTTSFFDVGDLLVESIIPAAPDEYGIEAWLDMDNDEVDIIYSRVIAWRLADPGPVPVFLDDGVKETSNSLIFTREVFGRWFCPTIEATVDSEAEIKERTIAHFKERAAERARIEALQKERTATAAALKEV